VRQFTYFDYPQIDTPIELSRWADYGIHIPNLKPVIIRAVLNMQCLHSNLAKHREILYRPAFHEPKFPAPARCPVAPEVFQSWLTLGFHLIVQFDKPQSGFRHATGLDACFDFQFHSQVTPSDETSPSTDLPPPLQPGSCFINFITGYVAFCLQPKKPSLNFIAIGHSLTAAQLFFTLINIL